MTQYDEIIPTGYESWRQCITVHCGIPLTSDFIAQRINSLNQANSEETQKFRRLYGDAHWQNVLSWYQRAMDQLT